MQCLCYETIRCFFRWRKPLSEHSNSAIFAYTILAKVTYTLKINTICCRSVSIYWGIQEEASRKCLRSSDERVQGSERWADTGNSLHHAIFIVEMSKFGYVQKIYRNHFDCFAFLLLLCCWNRRSGGLEQAARMLMTSTWCVSLLCHSIIMQLSLLYTDWSDGALHFALHA